MLGIYYADPSAAGPPDGELSSATLYRALLDNFIHRQVADKPERPPDDEELPHLLNEARWRLSIASFGMFNRGRQYVADRDLDRDLEIFLGRPGDGVHDLDSPVSRAHQTVSGFFFVHVARADESGDHARRTYEFLHATFGEYLIAERAVVLLVGYTRRRELYRSDPSAHEAPDDSMLRALLAYQPMSLRRPILEFGLGLMPHHPPERRAAMLTGARVLLAQARSKAFGQFREYAPQPADVVQACAAYTANLALLAAMLSGGSVAIGQLSPPGVEPARWWRSTMRLWEAGLDEESWRSLEPLLDEGIVLPSL